MLVSLIVTRKLFLELLDEFLDASERLCSVPKMKQQPELDAGIAKTQPNLVAFSLLDRLGQTVPSSFRVHKNPPVLNKPLFLAFRPAPV